jgi:hypothetical protein
MPRSAEWSGTSVTVELWRDYDPEARVLPGMGLGTRELDGAWTARAAELYDAGARCVRIPGTVDLCGGASAQSARTLVLIRELTSRGLAVEWVARCDDGCGAPRRFDHLYPPVRVLSATAEDARRWEDGYFPCKCVYRYGPGFVEVRDRRSGTLQMYTIDESPHLDAIAAMAEGVVAADVPAEVRRDLADADLVAEHAGHLWWLPMRLYRWPFPSLGV